MKRNDVHVRLPARRPGLVEADVDQVGRSGSALALERRRAPRRPVDLDQSPRLSH